MGMMLTFAMDSIKVGGLTTVSGLRNRYSCGFFVPVLKAWRTTFGGMIGRNKRPSGNTASRLTAVSESRHPHYGCTTKTVRRHFMSNIQTHPEKNPRINQAIDDLALSLSQARAIAEVMLEEDTLETCHHHHLYTCMSLICDFLRESDQALTVIVKEK